MQPSEQRCPSCNCEVAFEEGQKIRFCENCGKPLTFSMPKNCGLETEKEQISEPEAMLERACALINLDEYEIAESVLNTLLEEFPQYSDGYLVKLICRLRLKNINDLWNVDVPIDSFEEYRQAVLYGSPYQLNRLANLRDNNNAVIQARREKEETAKRKTVEYLKVLVLQLQESVDADNAFLRANQNTGTLPRWRKILRVAEKAFMYAVTGFFVFAGLFVAGFFLFAAPFAVRLVFILLRDRKTKHLLIKKHETTQRLEKETAQLLEAKRQLSELTASTAANGQL